MMMKNKKKRKKLNMIFDHNWKATIKSEERELERRLKELMGNVNTDKRKNYSYIKPYAKPFKRILCKKWIRQKWRFVSLGSGMTEFLDKQLK